MNRADARFGAVIAAMVTPFDEAGALDLDAAAALARWQTANGVDGLVIAGTTGESPVLSDDELFDLWRCVVEAVTVPVLAGSSNNDTRHSIRLTALARQAGVAGHLIVTPYYSRPPQRGIYEHFAAIAASTDLPILAYDIPVRAGRAIAKETMVAMARDIPNMVGVKDAVGNIGASAALLADMPSSFELYSGDDALALAHLVVGGVGVISVAANWAPNEMAEMIHCYLKGDAAGAERANSALVPHFNFETGDLYPNPLPAKAALRALGHRVGQCRLPMGSAPAELDQLAGDLVATLATRAA